MMVLILNKILLILFILSMLNIGRNAFLFILEWSKEEDTKIKLSPRNLFLLGLSVAYASSVIFLGITI
jgi:hypothetical protein